MLCLFLFRIFCGIFDHLGNSPFSILCYKAIDLKPNCRIDSFPDWLKTRINLLSNNGFSRPPVTLAGPLNLVMISVTTAAITTANSFK